MGKIIGEKISGVNASDMKKFFPKSVLITQGELINYAGSEVVTLELAEYFSQQGSRVDILTRSLGGPIIKEFKKLDNVTLHTIPSTINFKSLDLVWVHHQLIPDELLDLADSGKLRAKIIFHHMSPYHPLEFPFAPRIEQYLADYVLFNSLESQKAIEAKLSSIGFKGNLFNNPAPDAYARVAENKLYRAKPKNILVVSNHPPRELDETVASLVGQGFSVKSYGASPGQRHRRVTPKELAWADVVISIGKTVQYGILSGTPVYCYDHFGGPGYLNEANFEQTAQLNFSGRGFSKKRSALIVKEIINGYTVAQAFARQSYRLYAPGYTLSTQLSKVFLALRSLKQAPKKKLSLEDRVAFTNLSRWISQVNQDIFTVRGDYDQLLSRYHGVTKEHAKIISTLTGVVSSHSWKITRPLRQVKKGFFRRDSESKETDLK